MEIKKLKESNHDDNGDQIKAWCLKSYDTSYKSVLLRERRDLLEDVKAACILTIKTQLGDKAISVEQNQGESEFKQKAENLKNYNESTDTALSTELKKLKQEFQTTNEKNGEKLRDGCSEVYNRGFIGSNDSKGKLAETFCRKA